MGPGPKAVSGWSAEREGGKEWRVIEGRGDQRGWWQIVQERVGHRDDVGCVSE